MDIENKQRMEGGGSEVGNVSNGKTHVLCKFRIIILIISTYACPPQSRTIRCGLISNVVFP